MGAFPFGEGPQKEFSCTEEFDFNVNAVVPGLN